MIEVEVKLKIADPAEVEARLLQLGFAAAGRVRETDAYYDNAAAEIRTGSAALRIRKVEELSLGKMEEAKGASLPSIPEERRTVSGPSFLEKTGKCPSAAYAVITYKGQKLDRVTMTRPEYETEVSDPETADKILAALGYHVVPPEVMKLRKNLVRGEMTACLDHVQGLGDFLELEILVEESRTVDESRRMEKSRIAEEDPPVGKSRTAKKSRRMEKSRTAEEDPLAGKCRIAEESQAEGGKGENPLPIPATEEEIIGRRSMTTTAKRKAALDRIEEVLTKLGCSLEDTVTNSYLSMLQGREDA